jgi:formylglycine-generating enzyme required for sulfatase activity
MTMKRKSVFVVLSMACLMSMISCKKGAEQPTNALTIPSELTLDLGNKVTMKLVLIPAGKFLMGSPKDEKGRSEDEGPQHEVEISKPFYMGIYTATQEQYEKVMGKNPSEFKGTSNPVETVSWDDAVDFCKALSKETGKTVRLPTEAEWEYACRAGTTTPFNTGNTISTDEANYKGNDAYGDGKKGEFRQKTTPVGSFKKNAFALHDMHGNVAEWCADLYDSNYYANSPKIDPQGPNNGPLRVARGGGWNDGPLFCRSAARVWCAPTLRYAYLGFRVVVEIK